MHCMKPPSPYIQNYEMYTNFRIALKKSTKNRFYSKFYRRILVTTTLGILIMKLQLASCLTRNVQGQYMTTRNIF